MYLLALTIPLINFIVAIITRKTLHRKTIKTQLCLRLGITWIIRILIFYECTINETTCQTVLWKWIRTDYLKCKIRISLDLLSRSMLFIITTISLFVHIYSTIYLTDDPHTNRFMRYLSLFTFFMILLVTRNRVLSLFIGWEGVGICSYLLINFWLTRIQANKAGVKAIIINRIRDTTLLIRIILITREFGRIKFENIRKLTHNHYHIICLLLLLRAIGKSSLIGLHIWLPDAMEGPTPVSALIHAATMVTAGIFLLIRSSHILEKRKSILLLIAWLGIITAYFAATTRSLQNDIKRIIAYSTCSQLGYMALTIGLSHYSLRLLHLINHAFFKSLLFLGAGIIIHTIRNEQDPRKLRNLINKIPVTYIRILTGTLALTGLPFLTRYYSKDLIIENSFKHRRIFWLRIITAGLTALYSTRLISLTFFQHHNKCRSNYSTTKDNRKTNNWILLSLSILRLIAGYYFYHFILRFLRHTHRPTQTKILPLICRAIGTTLFLISQKHYNTYHTYKPYLYMLKTTLRNAWYFNTILNTIAQTFLHKSNSHTYKIIDQGILEDIGPNNIIKIRKNITNKIRLIQSSNLYTHMTLIILFYSIFIINNYISEAQRASKSLKNSKMQDKPLSKIQKQ
uniref:NADH-ubiquinone oxidoreductase chain 5 n=1 Tax=Aphrocallistes vastus TaxID=83887 RepID=B2BRP6_APHVA|nr:NADH dehydrogenase subunit 5 [Aphrocallistes vastus]ABR58840.1 NADH dehydrogenase subunit 5 [Aphrocallistes vastus]